MHASEYVFTRPVRFDEVDAAGYVYFARVVALAHEGLERMLGDALPGAYARLVTQARVGLPCVHVEADFRAPLRFGDDLEVALSTEKIGTSSATLAVTVRRGDGVECARMRYVVACTDLDVPSKRTLDGELRAAFARHGE